MRRGTVIGLAVVGLIGLAAVLVFLSRGNTGLSTGNLLTPEASVKELPFAKYAFAKLVERIDKPSEIEISENLFSYRSEGKLITGAINIPEGGMPPDGWPVVILLRGYVDPDIYATGMGTKNAAKFFAERGYVTLAPDFLGYGGSEEEDNDSLGARVVKPVAVLDLLASLPGMKMINPSRVYLWGHSNGGQIGLSVLEILGRREEVDVQRQTPKIQAASLWAPVSKPFPYSILYYTDESEDKGKALRAAIAKWETDYDVFDYSIDRYLGWIRTPIQIHQGTADDAVPVEWSNELAESLGEVESLQGQALQYYVYPGVDHNLRQVWDTVITRDLKWFTQFERDADR